MKKNQVRRTPEEKEKILQDIRKMGIVAGCKHYEISKSQYYDWLERYSAQGLEGFKDRRFQNTEILKQRLEKENKVLKELIAKEQQASRLKDELIKEMFAKQKKKGK